MFKFKKKSKEDYIDEHKFLCQINGKYNALVTEAQHENRLQHIINNWFSSRYTIYVVQYEINLSFAELSIKQIILLLMCCDKISKDKILTKMVYDYRYTKRCQKQSIRNGKNNSMTEWVDWFESLQIISAFINFEKVLSYFGDDARNEIIEFLIDNDFPPELFGKYGQIFVKFNNQKINVIKSTLSNFPLDILNIIKSFLPFEKPTEKSNCCIQ